MGNELDLNDTIGGKGRFTDDQRGLVVHYPTLDGDMSSMTRLVAVRN